jgi:hypothetical protein
MLGATFVVEIAQLHPIVGIGHADDLGVGRQVPQRAAEQTGAIHQIVAHARQRHNLPVIGQRRIKGRERVGDAAPFLNGHAAFVATVQHVPHE